MLRNIGAVLLGLVVGMAINMGLILANMSLFPGPDGLDFNDTKAMAEYVGSLPSHAMILPMLAHIGQAACGGWVAARLGASHVRILAMVVAVLTVVGSVMNFIQLPSPIWMWSEVPLELALGWVVGTVEMRRRANLSSD